MSLAQVRRAARAASRRRAGGGGGLVPAFVAAARAGDAQATIVTTLPIVIPATAATGQTAVLMVDLDGAPTITTPSGWTAYSAELGSTNSTYAMFTKTLAGGDPGATVTLTGWSGSIRCGAEMAVFSNVTTAGITQNVAVDSTAITPLVLPVATVAADTALIAAFVRRRSGVAGTIAVPSPYISPTNGFYSNTYATGANTFIGIGYVNAASGSVGGESATTIGVTSIGYNVLIQLPHA